MEGLRLPFALAVIGLAQGGRTSALDLDGRPARDDRRPRLEIAREGRAEPGGVVVLKSSRSADPAQRRWVQVSGPTARVEGPDDRADGPEAGEIRVIIPRGATTIGFLLAEARPGGIDVARIDVPVTTAEGPDDHPPVADAGPDQAGIQGQPVTLRGVAKGSADEVAYRWLQIAGPSAASFATDGASATFTPSMIGTYRLALVVAGAGRISEPDYVDVAVAPPPPPPPDLVAREGLAAIPGGVALGGPLADAFDAVADRMDLYASYSDVFAELSRRLDVIVPNDPASRTTWNRLLFEPLTGRLVDALRASGLDLLRPEAQVAPLDGRQRETFADLYRQMAKGFRAPRPAR